MNGEHSKSLILMISLLMYGGVFLYILNVGTYRICAKASFKYPYRVSRGGGGKLINFGLRFFIYIHTICFYVAKALTRLRICADSPESSCSECYKYQQPHALAHLLRAP